MKHRQEKGGLGSHDAGSQSAAVPPPSALHCQAIFRRVGNVSSFTIDAKTRAFPELADPYDGQTVMVSLGGVMFFYIAVMTQFVQILSSLVSEKEHNLRCGMALMGMTQSAFWVHWLVTAMLVSASSACLWDIQRCCLSLCARRVALGTAWRGGGPIPRCRTEGQRVLTTRRAAQPCGVCAAWLCIALCGAVWRCVAVCGIGIGIGIGGPVYVQGGLPREYGSHLMCVAT